MNIYFCHGNKQLTLNTCTSREFGFYFFSANVPEKVISLEMKSTVMVKAAAESSLNHHLSLRAFHSFNSKMEITLIE